MLVLDLWMVVVEVSGTWYLVPGRRRNTYACMLAFPWTAMVKVGVIVFLTLNPKKYIARQQTRGGSCANRLF